MRLRRCDDEEAAIVMLEVGGDDDNGDGVKSNPISFDAVRPPLSLPLTLPLLRRRNPRGSPSSPLFHLRQPPLSGCSVQMEDGEYCELGRIVERATYDQEVRWLCVEFCACYGIEGLGIWDALVFRINRFEYWPMLHAVYCGCGREHVFDIIVQFLCIDPSQHVDGVLMGLLRGEEVGFIFDHYKEKH
ncbi:hypothetical protein AKJ16_DCAP19243 [Drosera capensis]